MLKINIETIPHDKQRYNTIGDWMLDVDAGVINITVSDMGDFKKEATVAIHELAEVCLCLISGVKQEQVDSFDMDYEMNRKPGDDSEPGDSTKAPYHKEHKAATFIERVFASEGKINWELYEKAINDLCHSYCPIVPAK